MKNVHTCIRQTPRHNRTSQGRMQWFQETWGQCTRPPAGAIHATQAVHAEDYSVQLAIGCGNGIYYQKF
jgi:hypothetical protein